jgi:hypothetical protein
MSVKIGPLPHALLLDFVLYVATPTNCTANRSSPTSYAAKVPYPLLHFVVPAVAVDVIFDKGSRNLSFFRAKIHTIQ